MFDLFITGFRLFRGTSVHSPSLCVPSIPSFFSSKSVLYYFSYWILFFIFGRFVAGAVTELTHEEGEWVVVLLFSCCCCYCYLCLFVFSTELRRPDGINPEFSKIRCFFSAFGFSIFQIFFVNRGFLSQKKSGMRVSFIYCWVLVLPFGPARWLVNYLCGSRSESTSMWMWELWMALVDGGMWKVRLDSGTKDQIL